MFEPPNLVFCGAILTNSGMTGDSAALLPTDYKSVGCETV